MTKYLKYLLIILLAFIFANFQIGFFNPLNIYYLFLILVIILVLFKFNLALNFAFWLGLFLDLINQINFGVITISLIITTYFLYYLFINYLTHKNFLTYLVLMTIGFFIFNVNWLIIYFLLSIIGQPFKLLDQQSLRYLYYQFLIYLLIFIVIFSIFFLLKKIYKLRKYEY